MLKSSKATLLAAAVLSAAADASGSGSGSAATVSAINVTFCASTYPTYDSTEITKGWRKGQGYTRTNIYGGDTDLERSAAKVKAEKAGEQYKPRTVKSHYFESQGSSMVVASGSCFLWNHHEDLNSDWKTRSQNYHALSARAWCEYSGDQPTVQFYSGGGCAEGSEVSDDDKGKLFWTPDTCGGAKADDGIYAALGAFSCVSVKDEFVQYNACPQKADDLKKNKLWDDAGTANTAEVKAVYTLATDTCSPRARQSNVPETVQDAYGAKGNSLWVEGGRVLGGNAKCVDSCGADSPLELKDEKMLCSVAADQSKEPCKTDSLQKSCSAFPVLFNDLKPGDYSSCSARTVADKDCKPCSMADDKCDNPTNPNCQGLSCSSRIMRATCSDLIGIGGKSESAMSYTINSNTVTDMATMKDAKQLQDRPINWTLWIIIIVVVLVIVVIVVVAMGGKKGGGAGGSDKTSPAAEAAPAADEEAAPAAEEEAAPAAEEEAAPAAEE